MIEKLGCSNKFIVLPIRMRFLMLWINKIEHITTVLIRLFNLFLRNLYQLKCLLYVPVQQLKS